VLCWDVLYYCVESCLCCVGMCCVESCLCCGGMCCIAVLSLVCVVLGCAALLCLVSCDECCGVNFMCLYGVLVLV